MRSPIAIFFHCLFFIEEQELPCAFEIVWHQIELLKRVGLMDSAAHICVGINGGNESVGRVYLLKLPHRANVVMHGLKSRNENLTIVEIEKWLPGHGNWNVLYFHSKAASHPPGPSADFGNRWRNRMMQHCIVNWRQCVDDLDAGHDAVGCHWLPGMADGTQNLFGGNFWWAKASFLAKLPSILERARIKVSGIESLESRYEAEVWIGNGPTPNVKDYYPGHPNMYR